jgi:hypothetical protein
VIKIPHGRVDHSTRRAAESEIMMVVMIIMIIVISLHNIIQILLKILKMIVGSEIFTVKGAIF